MGSGGMQFMTVKLKTESGKATPEQLGVIPDLQRDCGRAGMPLSAVDAARIALD